MVGHRIPVARVGRVLVCAIEIAGCRQPESPARAGRQDHRLGCDLHEFTGARVQCSRADGPTLLGEHAHGHQPVLDGDVLAHVLFAQHSVEGLLDVLALGHGEHVRTRAMDSAHRVLTVFVLLELHAVLLETPDHREATSRRLIHGLLVDDAVVGPGDLGDVRLRRRLAGDDGVVHAIHTHGKRT